MPPDCPYNLSGKVGLVLIDECQVARNLESTYSHAIRSLDGQFSLLLTATPVPWAVTGFAGLLKLMSDDHLEREAAEAASHDELRYSYDKAARPENRKFIATHFAFKRYVRIDHALSKQGTALKLVWKETMNQASYRWKCVTHPSGDVHTLGNLMPDHKAVRVTFTIGLPVQTVNDLGKARIREKLYIHDPTVKAGRVNGNVLRRLNLGSFCPMLFFADSIKEVEGNEKLHRLSRYHDNRDHATFLRNAHSRALVGL